MREGGSMADVFVSYKAEDRKRIRPLVEALQAEGYGVWWMSRSAAAPPGATKSKQS